MNFNITHETTNVSSMIRIRHQSSNIFLLHLLKKC